MARGPEGGLSAGEGAVYNSLNWRGLAAVESAAKYGPESALMSHLRIATLAVIVIGAAADARADRISLRGGGELRGVAVPDPEHPEKTLVLTEKGGAPIAFDRAQILKVVRVPGPLDEYVKRRDHLESTAEAEFELGQWCEEQGLAGLADVHYRRAIGRDKAFGPAHKKLGHVSQAGRWLTLDQVRQAQGMVKVRGKWITSEEKARLDAGAALSAEQSSWTRRLKIYRQAYFSEKADVHQRAEQDLFAIREPAAVVPLVRTFAGDSEPARRLVVQVVAAIPGPEAMNALIGLILADSDPSVRTEAADSLTGRGEAGAASPQLIKALQQVDPAVVGRAAAALAAFNEASAVPKLVGALVRVDEQVVFVPSENAQPAGPSYIFGGGPSIPYLTGPVIGPGIIAYGAGSVPLFSGVAAGGGVGGAPRGAPEPRLVRTVQRNDEVLDALVRMTGVNFGFDVPAWKGWLASSFRPAAAHARRVPQP